MVATVSGTYWLLYAMLNWVINWWLIVYLQINVSCEHNPVRDFVTTFLIPSVFTAVNHRYVWCWHLYQTCHITITLYGLLASFHIRRWRRRRYWCYYNQQGCQTVEPHFTSHQWIFLRRAADISMILVAHRKSDHLQVFQDNPWWFPNANRVEIEDST